MVAFDFASRSRFTGTLDTAGVTAIARAERAAQRRGAKGFYDDKRSFSPLAIRSDGDTIEVWLIPAAVYSARTRMVGGERGYVFTPNGRQLVREVDSFADYREIQLPDSGQIRIQSTQAAIPTFSEFVLANLLHDSGRWVAIETRRMTSFLVAGRGGDAWMHVARR